MDTDDLSKEAYYGILIEAEKLSPDLTLLYGLLSSDCENEAEYLDEAEKLTKEILKADDFELDDLFWGDPPKKNKLINTCKKILKKYRENKSHSL